VAIALGSIEFDENTTAIREELKEIGGRDARAVRLSGIVIGEHSVEAVEARLDAILAMVPEDACTTSLAVRPGRRFFVRRTGFSREVNKKTLTGSFVLDVAADDPFEQAVVETAIPWSVTASGDHLAVETAGTANALWTIVLVPAGDIVRPAFSDGTRTLVYDGVVADGQGLETDGAAGRVTLDGKDVTPYTEGLFPRIGPPGASLVYTDEGGSHAASVTVRVRDRWF